MNRSSGLAHLRWQLAPCIPIGAVIVALIVVPRAATVPSTAPVKNPATRPILFERYSGEDAPKCCQIFVVHADGRGLKRLRFGSSPSWSPNSQRIAFVRFDDSAVVIMRADGRGTRRVSAPLDSGGSHARATWSPDGRQLAWATAERGRAVVRIATLSRPIALRKILLPDIGFGSPDWSPDGRQFALVLPCRWDLCHRRRRPPSSPCRSGPPKGSVQRCPLVTRWPEASVRQTTQRGTRGRLHRAAGWIRLARADCAEMLLPLGCELVA